MFQKATRKQAKLKIALTGPSGSGKTMSALRMAKAMGKKIAVIDTENGSASLYADKFDFDTVNIEPPFTHDKYLRAIEAAERAGYDVIIVDSFSHAWSGEGGALDKKSMLDARGGGFNNWQSVKRDYGHVKNAILHSTSHIITTIRSKQAYVLVEENGKSKPQKIGLDPIAEPGIEYEYTVVFDLAADNTAMVSKTRIDFLKPIVGILTEKTGETLMTWLAGGVVAFEEKKDEPTQPEEPANAQPLKKIDIKCRLCGGEMRAHKSGQGYICESAVKKGDGHSRLNTSDLRKFQSEVQPAQTA